MRVVQCNINVESLNPWFWFTPKLPKAARRQQLRQKLAEPPSKKSKVYDLVDVEVTEGDSDETLSSEENAATE